MGTIIRGDNHRFSPRVHFFDENEESESDKNATGCSNGDENPQNLVGNDELTMNFLVQDKLRNKNGEGMWDSCSDQHGEYTQNREKNDII